MLPEQEWLALRARWVELFDALSSDEKERFRELAILVEKAGASPEELKLQAIDRERIARYKRAGPPLLAHHNQGKKT